MAFPYTRMRRLRRFDKLRVLLREVNLTPNNIIYPIFVKEGITAPEAIETMPGQLRYPVEHIVKVAEEVTHLGIPGVIIFGIPSKKDDAGSTAFSEEGIVQRAVKAIKKGLGDALAVVTDVCLCQYTTHGHCGIVKEGEVVNDETIAVLGRIARSHAEAGTDIVAPSAMMDGQVRAVRRCLDEGGFDKVAIMAYSAKYASCFYAPFREAAHSTPAFGDRRGYQMDHGNLEEALREVELDIKEGADIVMVKPALAYLDVIYRIKERFRWPTAAFNVSGEYAMISAAAEKGWIDEKSAILEVLATIKRAGADIILTYWALDAARWLREAEPL